MIQAVIWKGDHLLLLDQRLLPERIEYVKCKDYREVADGIRDMVVRGAPAIGIAGGYGVALSTAGTEDGPAPKGATELANYITAAAHHVASARPTAVNLQWAVDRVLAATLKAIENDGTDSAFKTAAHEAMAIEEEDVKINKAIGAHGARLVKPGATILTHCNAGALATGGYGTALGVVRKAWEEDKVSMVYACETRPYLQGARLTAWELIQDGIDVTILVDSAAGYLISQGKVDFIVVGADRVARNGDVANKIGTYTLACLAQRHRVPFYVASPISTFDLSLESGDQIPVEERDENEVLTLLGKSVAPVGARAFNPAFDITPASLICGIITEKGVIRHPVAENIQKILVGDDARA